LYRCGTGFVAVREAEGIFIPKMDEVAGGWKYACAYVTLGECWNNTSK
jgi:hypothetical protein